mgnify:CR=1 FL=1
MPAPPVSRLILLLSGSGLSLRVLGQLPYPLSCGILSAMPSIST